MARPELVIIAAIAKRNRVIGKDNKLPWHISEDLKRFKRLTVGHAVIMGRKTFESIIARNGRPLPDRLNIVLSHSRNFPEFPGVATARSLDDALRAAREHSPAFVIGGETIYAAALPQADRLELTLVDGDYLGDAFFPEFEHLLETEFEETAFEKGEGYRFVTYERL